MPSTEVVGSERLHRCAVQTTACHTASSVEQEKAPEPPGSASTVLERRCPFNRRCISRKVSPKATCTVFPFPRNSPLLRVSMASSLSATSWYPACHYEYVHSLMQRVACNDEAHTRVASGRLPLTIQLGQPPMPGHFASGLSMQVRIPSQLLASHILHRGKVTCLMPARFFWWRTHNRAILQLLLPASNMLTTKRAATNCSHARCSTA